MTSVGKSSGSMWTVRQSNTGRFVAAKSEGGTFKPVKPPKQQPKG